MGRFVAALLLCFVAAAPVAAAPVTITSSYISSGTQYSSHIDNSSGYGTRTLTSSAAGSSSTTVINWQDTGTGALFDFDFAHVRNGIGVSVAQSYGNTLRFTVGPNDVAYSLSGLYSMTGPTSRTFSSVSLRDYYTDAWVFRDDSESFNTANELFLLGAPNDGDYYNLTSGSLTGTLQAGHTYQLFFNDFIYWNQADAGATATGCVTLSIGGASAAGTCAVAPVPLPAAAWLLLSGLGGLGLFGRRRAA